MKKIIIFTMTLFFISCSNSTVVSKEKSNLTVGVIKNKIIENKTTQTEIIELFGSPNLITTNSKKQEVWTYNKSSFEVSNNSQSNNVWLLLFSSSKSSTLSNASTSSLDLIITFNKNEVVEKYKLISAVY